MHDKFLINTLTAWDEPPRARHQLTYALAEKHQVVFVTRNRFGIKPGIEISRVKENITLVTPVYPMDYRLRIRIPGINKLYQRWLYRRLVKEYGGYQVVNFDFTARHLHDYFRNAVYYCNDEILGNSKYPNWFTDQYYRFCERQVIEKSPFCVTTSAYLTGKLKRFNPNTIEIPLGANGVYEKAAFSKKKDNAPIVVCLLGFINERHISVDLLNDIISEGLFHLVLIGPSEESFTRKLKKSGEVTLKGVMKGEELTRTLAEMDVGLALYNKKRINPGVTPNKLYQYLAVGKPAVVSQLDNLRVEDFPEKSVYVFNEGDSLKDLIQKAYSEDSEALFLKRLAFARNNTWEKRVDRFLEVLRERL